MLTALLLAMLAVFQPPAPTAAAQAAHDRARDFVQRGLYYEAERHFAEAIKFAPDWGPGHYGVAISRYFTKRYELALPALDRAIACPQPLADYFANKGVILEVLGRVDEARPLFEEALKRDENHVNSWFNLGQIALRTGKVDKARERIQTVLRLQADHLGARYWLAKIEFRSRYYEKAEVIANEVAAKDPDHYESRYLLAQISFRTGHRDLGKKRLADCRVLRARLDTEQQIRGKVSSLLDLAFGFLNKRDVVNGVAYFKTVLGLDPSNRHALNALRRIQASYAKAGRQADVDRIAAMLADAAARTKK